jgi:hypothetical protein
MASRLIELEDGTLVEVEAAEDDVQEISFKSADHVSETLDRVKPILVNACRPLAAAWHELQQDMDIEQAEVELGLAFEGEGNVYLAKMKGSANLVVKLTLKPRAKEGSA